MNKIKFLITPNSFDEKGAFVAHLEKVNSKEILFQQLKEKLKFPECFGFNWDALSDCLRDLHWIKQGKISIVHDDLPKLKRKEFSIYLEILINAINDWKVGESHHLEVVFPKENKDMIQSYYQAKIGRQDNGSTLPSNMDKYKDKLHTWIQESISSKAWERFDDLHLDEIDENLIDSSKWVDEGLAFYDLTKEILDGEKPFKCILIIQLSDATDPTPLMDINLEYLRINVDQIRPHSIYLFPVGNIILIDTLKESLHLDKLSTECGYGIYYKEEKEKEDEGGYTRTIYVYNN